MEIRKSLTFGDWYLSLRDATAKAAIERMASGNLGESSPSERAFLKRELMLPQVIASTS